VLEAHPEGLSSWILERSLRRAEFANLKLLSWQESPALSTPSSITSTPASLHDKTKPKTKQLVKKMEKNELKFLLVSRWKL
jgi:hypothetical protein